MSISFRVPHGSAPLPKLPDAAPDRVSNRLIHFFRAMSDEAAVCAANDALSGASGHARHPDPRSGLLESHIFPVIYTKYHFEDLKFGYLQYTKEMVEKHHGKGTILSQGDIATYWVIQVRREYPDGHPLRRMLMEQVQDSTASRNKFTSTNGPATDGPL